MTINYFMCTKDGEDLSVPGYLPFARGSSPAVTAVADKRRKTARTNLVSGGSFESASLSGWNWSSGANIARSTAEAAVGSASLAFSRAAAGSTTKSFWDSSGAPVTAVLPYLFQVKSKAATTPRYVYILVSWYDAGGGFLTVTGSTAAVNQNNTFSWTTFTFTDVAPAGAASAQIEVGVNPNGATAPAGEVHYFDDVRVEVMEDPTLTGLPSALSGKSCLYLPTGAPDDDALPNGRGQMVWPSGFHKSVFRAVRDPAIATDDSGNTLGTQVYNHGWLIAERLAWYLRDLYEVDDSKPTWSAVQTMLYIVPVTGTSAVNDGKGWHGLTSVTWPGSGVGVGTLRQLISGDEGSTRKVAAILDLLAATTNGQRSTMGDQFTANQSAIRTAHDNLQAAAGAPWPGYSWPWTDPEATRSAAQNQCVGRMPLNMFLGRAAVGEDFQSSSALGNAVGYAMMAITAKEAGLIGATFTTANYETMTDPIDAVLAMPSGY